MELEDISDEELISPMPVQTKADANTTGEISANFIDFNSIKQIEITYKNIPYTTTEERPFDLTNDTLRDANYQDEPMNLVGKKTTQSICEKPMTGYKRKNHLIIMAIEKEQEHPLNLSNKLLIYHPSNVNRIVSDIMEELDTLRNNEALDLSRTILVSTQAPPLTPEPKRSTLSVKPTKRPTMINFQQTSPRPGPSWRQTPPHPRQKIG